jgi:hypothetical protein
MAKFDQWFVVIPEPRPWIAGASVGYITEPISHDPSENPSLQWENREARRSPPPPAFEGMRLMTRSQLREHEWGRIALREWEEASFEGILRWFEEVAGISVEGCSVPEPRANVLVMMPGGKSDDRS